MLEAEESNEATILDNLNEDCWRAVLQYVPVRHLIRTECASRRWQEVVLTYLQGVHINIEEEDENYKNKHYTCSLKPSKYKSFIRWTAKLGPSVASTYCSSWKNLAAVKVNCPNLEALQVSHVVCDSKQLLQNNLKGNFKFLQKVSFYGCSIDDPCLSQILADKALEELEFSNCHNFNGHFFNSINLSNLKSLVLDYCRGLEPKYVLPAINRLGELVKLKVTSIPYEIVEEMQLLLDKMPKLEWLELYDSLRMSCHSSEPLSRLTRLKHLKVCFQLGDCDVEAVTRSCQELLTLDLIDCQGMSSHSVEMLVRHAGARLTSLELGAFYEAEDDDVVALIRGCPRLTLLTVSGTGLLTPLLPARAAAARREAAPSGSCLRLDLSDTNLTDDCYLEEVKDQYEEMKTIFENLIVVL